MTEESPFPDPLYWSVFGHMAGKGVDCLFDFAEETSAIMVGEKLESPLVS